MLPVFEQVAELNRAYVANVLKSMDVAVDFVTKASNFTVKAGNEFAQATVADLHALAAVKAPHEFLPLRAKQLEEKAEWAVSTSREAIELVSNAQAEALALVEAQAAEAAKLFVTSLDKVAKSAPQNVPGVDYAISALKAGVETSLAAFETVAKASKESVEFAGQQVKAAASSAAAKRSK
ncbi:MAG: phasin family protein [Casimicrobiaceae bacterium]|nr:phasin family protein [Casimicrobiaceae bacterium]MCX8098730.1 phasin family protein [Casimicrobiaceae bacterium]MDW8312169.1 phasin family protein [Burkholderiales bacterium]